MSTRTCPNHHIFIFALAFVLWAWINLLLRRKKKQNIIQKEIKILTLKRFKNKIKSDEKQNQNTMVLKKETIKNLNVLVFGLIFLWSCLTFYDLYRDFSWKENIDQFRWFMFNVKINLSAGIYI